MRFYFLPDDRNLFLPASQGGCGVTDAELLDITVWQKVHTYQFELHLENHGPYVYIFPDGRRAGQKDMPRYYFGGGRVGTFDNEKSLHSTVQRDVEAIVDGNRDLFEAIHARFYGLGGVAKKTIEVGPRPALSYFTCISPACSGRDQIIAVKFASQPEMWRQIRVSNFGGIRSTEYPVVRCSRQACGMSLELVEFGSAAASQLKVKETIDFAG